MRANKFFAILMALALPLVILLLGNLALTRAAPGLPDLPTARSLNPGQPFLPPWDSECERFGFNAIGNTLADYDVAPLCARWYNDWQARIDPLQPDGMTYVQTIILGAGSNPHDPAQVTISPGQAVIAQIAAANPGSLWLVGNEPDSIYQGTPIYPDVYAHVYHDTYHYIKSLDPTALIANGGIVQPTPCRMMYLDIVWDTYQQAYGETMPVDVWNIHAFILREVYGSWGASTPPGVPISCSIDYRIREGDDINIFRDNLIAFRQWMKDKGEQNKPLIISEYGILWPNWLQDEDGNGWSPERVSDFMVQTFDLFLTETFPDVGYPEDDYRLVQNWAWYSLSDDQTYNGYLFHSNTKALSAIGQVYADYTSALAQANFTADSRHGVAPLTIHFTDTSGLCGPATGWEWTFGDEDASALQHPTHTYMAPGVYTVGLTVWADESATRPGRVATLTRTNYITVDAMRADFTAWPTFGVLPLTVIFTNTSSGDYTANLWSLRDGVTSTSSSPTHTYTTAGTYTVTLALNGPGGSDTLTRTNYISVYTPAHADFTAWPTSGVSPLTVIFTNTSSGDYTTSLWNFGDNVTSTSSSPTHTYTTAGTYTVTLALNGPGGSDTLAHTNYITAYAPVHADFMAWPTFGVIPLTVIFTNTSSGDYTTSMWSLGDGVTSTSSSTPHTYTTAGTYTVTLALNGPGESDTETKVGYIAIRYSVYLPLVMRQRTNGRMNE